MWLVFLLVDSSKQEMDKKRNGPFQQIIPHAWLYLIHN